jgi:hypothetical protein
MAIRRRVGFASLGSTVAAEDDPRVLGALPTRVQGGEERPVQEERFRANKGR